MGAGASREAAAGGFFVRGAGCAPGCLSAKGVGGNFLKRAVDCLIGESVGGLLKGTIEDTRRGFGLVGNTLENSDTGVASNVLDIGAASCSPSNSLTAGADGKQPLIRVQNLTKYYHEELVLKDISVAIEEGDLVSIIGPSGCGKSTFLRCLNGMEMLDCGSVNINGISLQRKTPSAPMQDFNTKAHALRQQVGMVFQTFNLFPHKTLLQNVMMAPMIVQKKSRDEAEAIAVKFLDKVGLKAFSHRYPVQLSGGQQQRGAIARALALSPKVMLYDEPTSAIDPTRVDEVLEVMRDLDKESMTQIVVTHEMRFAKDASDYIIYMEQGEFVEISDEDEIFIAPKDERTHKFLKKFM